MLQKIIKRIVKASKVSRKNAIKIPSRRKKFMKKFIIKFFRVATVKEKSI